MDGLVVIGGEGSLKGALAFARLGMPTTGVPATIDNDVPLTDMAIGVDTALEAIDRIKDTASSHRRAHVVEVMGRNCGYLALSSALAGGAEAVLLPEVEPYPEDLICSLASSYERGKPHFIVVAAEGARLSAQQFHEYVNATEDSRTRARATDRRPDAHRARRPRPAAGSLATTESDFAALKIKKTRTAKLA